LRRGHFSRLRNLRRSDLRRNHAPVQLYGAVQILRRPAMKKAYLALALAFALAPFASAQQQQPSTTESQFTLKVNSDIVLTNVVLRDKKTGEVVRGLTAKDFTLQENGKTQRISSFDFESVNQAVPLNEATINGQS